MLKREIESPISNDIALSTKVILVSGLKKVGKSYIVRSLDSRKEYISLSNLENKEFANDNPKLFIANHSGNIIIDEIQEAPVLLDFIEEAIEGDITGLCQYILISSDNTIIPKARQIFKDKVSIFNFMGLSAREIHNISIDMAFCPDEKYMNTRKHSSIKRVHNNIYKNIWLGSFPQLHFSDKEIKLEDWMQFFDDYYSEYIKPEIFTLIGKKQEFQFISFLRAIATRTATILDYNSIANTVGISPKTTKQWIQKLEDMGLIYLLPCYPDYIGDRLIKANKIYFADTGLCCYLTKWINPDVIEHGALADALFETYCVMEILKSYRNKGIEPELSHYKDKDKRVIDLIITIGNKNYPILFKRLENPKESMTRPFSVVWNHHNGAGAIITSDTNYTEMQTKYNLPIYTIPASFI